MEAELKCQRTRDRQDSFALHVSHAMWIFQSPKTSATVLKAVGKFIKVRHFGDMAFPPTSGCRCNGVGEQKIASGAQIRTSHFHLKDLLMAPGASESSRIIIMFGDVQ